MKVVRKKISRHDIIKNYTSKKALVPPAQVHVKVAAVNVTDSLTNAICIMLYELGVFCARRKMEVHSFTTENISYEKDRQVGIDHKPRVSLNILSNKEDKTGEMRDSSLHGTRETVLSCSCKGTNNPQWKDASCPIIAFDPVWKYRKQLYLELKKMEGKQRSTSRFTT